MRSEQWHVISIVMDHPVHGRFFLGLEHGNDCVSAQRAWHVGNVCHAEWIGEPGQSHANLDAAKAAVEARIRELDALVASEQLEACGS